MKICRTLYATGGINRWCDRVKDHEGPCAGMILPKYRDGQTVRITDTLRLATRMHRASPDGTLRGAGHQIIDRDVIETPAIIYTTTKDRMLVGWHGGDMSVWIDQEDAVPAK